VASFVVDGVVVPVSVGGHPALDFCNTRAGWGAAAPKEYLHTYNHLAVWARENGLVAAASMAGLSLTASAHAKAASAVVNRAIEFRSALYAVLVGPALVGPTSAAEWAIVDREVQAAASALRLLPGRPATWTISDQSRVDLPLLAVAWSAAGLLTSAAGSQVGACPGVGCGWLFANPHGRRRWCSMAWCGNRDKVRRHAERARGTGASTGATNV
jgi:predicted RNA-binding Zn ribbon-like protein